jgi:molybdopterin-guanine dinucleotide biosynthesis protein A
VNGTATIVTDPELLEACAVRYIDEAELGGVDPGLRSFRNLNTPADYAEWVRSQPSPR